ncbi:MAG: iron ABC transporter permease [Bacteroidetes bacterium]|nr:iron ABC transporter permease [Bacteroidota bacterium]
MKLKSKYTFPLLMIVLVIVLLVSIVLGAVSISLEDMRLALTHWANGKQTDSIVESVFIQIRLPRVLLCAVTGAILSVSGVLMQGLFRNPIVEPGLVGTSAGAALGASFVFVFASWFGPNIQVFVGPFLVPLFAFIGGLIATLIVYQLSKSNSRVSLTSLLLVGVAINAVALSGTGFMTYLARDPQARSISFWNLGTFTGANWFQVELVSLVALVVLFLSLKDAKKLNAFILGEEEAGYLGIDTKKLKRKILIANTAMVAIATSFVGVIGFMGLIVPHVMRLLVGSDHRKLLPASMLGGAALLLIADMGARLLLAPAEIPIGIITSLVGAPVYILLLKGNNLIVNKGGNRD